MINLPKKYLLGGIASIALLAVTGYISYNKGYENGANSVQVKFDAYKLETKTIIDGYIQKQKDQEIAIQKANDNVRIETVTKLKVETETIEQTKYVNRDVIKTVFKDSPFIPTGVVYAHDQLALGKEIDPVRAGDLSPSPYTWVDYTDIVSENYSTLNEARKQQEAFVNYYENIRANFGPSSNSLPTESN